MIGVREGRDTYIRHFLLWCEERGLNRPQDITKSILVRYQRYQFLYRKEEGQPLEVCPLHFATMPARHGE